MDTTLMHVEQICREVFNNPELSIQYQTSANDIEAWDSMTNLFLIDMIEKKMNFKFSLSEILEAQNIGDLCKIIDQKKIG